MRGLRNVEKIDAGPNSCHNIDWMYVIVAFTFSGGSGSGGGRVIALRHASFRPGR